MTQQIKEGRRQEGKAKRFRGKRGDLKTYEAYSLSTKSSVQDGGRDRLETQLIQRRPNTWALTVANGRGRPISTPSTEN